MAFTVGDCCNINAVLSFVAGIKNRNGDLTTERDALAAALVLNRRAHNSLGAGLDDRDIVKGWPNARGTVLGELRAIRMRLDRSTPAEQVVALGNAIRVLERAESGEDVIV